jgi:hypothetical protein
MAARQAFRLLTGLVFLGFSNRTSRYCPFPEQPDPSMIDT